MTPHRLPYPLIYPFKGKGQIALVMANLRTEHARLTKAAHVLIQDVEGTPCSDSPRLPLRLEQHGPDLVWRTEHSLDRNRPFALFSSQGETIRSRLATSALHWLVQIEHRRLLHQVRMHSVALSLEALGTALSSISALEARLRELGGHAPDPALPEPPSPAQPHPCGAPPPPVLSAAARRRRRSRRPAALFAGRASALRNLDDLTGEQARVVKALNDLREDWRPRIAASGIGLFPGDGQLPAMRWRVTNATRHGKRRRIQLTDPESLAILKHIESRVALRAIATESIRIDWSARAAAIHGSRLAYIDYRESALQLQAHLKAACSS